MENKPIDWEQRRYEIAKAVIQGIYANSRVDDIYYEHYAAAAMTQAEILIEQLKHGTKRN